MRDILIAALIFGSIPVILFRPYVGVLVWTWLSLMNPHRLAWGFATSFPFGKVVGGVTCFSALVSRDKKRIPITRESIILGLLFVWIFVTSLLALEPESAWTQWSKVSKILLIVFVTMVLLTDRKRVEAFVWMIVLSIGFYGVKGGLFTIATGGSYHVLGPQESFIADNNHLGLALLMTVPMMRYLQQASTRRWLRHGLLAAMGLTVLSVLGTQSRGAFVGLSATLLFLVFRSRHKVLLGALSLSIIPITFALMPDAWFERMESIRHYREDPSAMGRINAWSFAINLVLDRPLVGGGFECFTSRWFATYAPDPTDVHDAHSIYFEILAEQGVIGLILFLALALSSWRTCTALIRESESDRELLWLSDLMRMVQVGLVAYAVTGLFVGLAYFDLYYNVIAILVSAKLIATQHAHASRIAERARNPGPATHRARLLLR
jgi:probable O-glycosylation ligase (exosortase A-associated)